MSIIAIELLSENQQREDVLPSPFMKILSRLFEQFAEKRQKHLNDVTALAWHLMHLRNRLDATYHCNMDVEMDDMKSLLLAYNFHDIGDLVPFHPGVSFETPDIHERKKTIQNGDWISSADYSDEKFYAPIKGKALCQAILKMWKDPDSLSETERNILIQCDLMHLLNFFPDELVQSIMATIENVAYCHHETYNGKGWPEGIKLDPRNILYDITFFDFIAGWFSDKQIRGENPIFIKASTPDKALSAIHQREKINQQKFPNAGPMYHPEWTLFFEKYLSEITRTVASIFPDVRKQTGG